MTLRAVVVGFISSTMLCIPTMLAQSGEKMPPPAGKGLVPWTLREDFRSGIPGWTSYPLPQDVGYDPSLYTTQLEGSPVLVRKMISRGEERLRVGLLRQLHFLAIPASAFEITYRLEMGGVITGGFFTLVSEDGKKYQTALPFSPGKHKARISGEQLHLPPPGVDAEAIVIETQVSHPVRGSDNRLTVCSFSIDSRQIAPVIIGSPHIVRSPGSGISVASRVVTRGTQVQIEFVPAAYEGVLEIMDGSGTIESKENIPPGASRVSIPEKIQSRPGVWRVRIRRGSAVADFRLLVVGDTPTHPRLLLTRERIEQLKSHEASAELKRIVHQRASKLAASIAMNPTAGENIARLSRASPFPGLVPYFKLMEDYSNAIGYNAVDFCLTGDRHALEITRQALLTVAEWSTWTPPWFLASGLHTYYEVGVATQRMAFGYDLVTDEFNSEEQTKIIAGFWRNSIKPTVDDYFLQDTIPTGASNHQAQSLGGAIAAAVVMYGDVPEWNDRLSGALAELAAEYERVVGRLFPGDGSEAEPGGYQNFAMQGLSWGMAGLHALGITPHGSDNMVQSFWWLRYVELHPGRFLDTGDFDGEVKALSGFAWGAEFSGDPALRDFYDTSSEQSLGGLFRLPPTAAVDPTMADTGRSLEGAPGLLDLVCCTRPKPSLPVPPLSRLFPKRGSAALRSGWGSHDTVISLRVGAWFNHEHHDQGSFQVAAFGETLIGEAGYSDYYRDPHYADYFSEAPGHNTVLLDGNPFSQSSYDGRYWRGLEHYPRFIGNLFSAGIDYIVADLAPAYAGTLSRFAREYLFLKPDVLIVHDRLESSKRHRYDWLLHIPPEATVRETGSNAVVRGKAASAVITTVSQDLRWSIESTFIPISEYSDLDGKQVRPRQQIKLVSQPESKADFLVGMHFTQTAPEKAGLHPLRTASAEGFSGNDAGREISVLFRKKGGLLAARNIKADGNVLAVVENADAIQILACEVRSVHQREQEIFSSNKPVNLVLNTALGGEELSIGATTLSALRIVIRSNPMEVLLDGHPAPVAPSEGLLLLNVTKGKHSVSIRY